MKILLMASLLLALMPRGCADENEDSIDNEPLEGVSYVAKDIEVRKAVSEWTQFIKESDSVILSAKIQISRAVDRSDDPKWKHNLKFRNEIYHADGKLERLSEKLLWAKKFEKKEATQMDDQTLKKMASFKNEFREDTAKLNSILLKLKAEENK
jgi:hypothetical protein